MEPTSTRLGVVLDGLLTAWRASLAPSGWVVVDGPVLGDAVPPLTISVGVGNEVNGDPYRVEVSNFDMAGRHEEQGTVRCQLAAVAADARDLKPTRDVVLTALAAIDQGLRAPGIAGADRIVLGDQQWWQLTNNDASVLIVSCNVDVHWTAWL